MPTESQRISLITAMLASRARWGWACVRDGSLRCDTVRATAASAEADTAPSFAHPGRNDVIEIWPTVPDAVPVLVIGSMFIRITEADLADLGPCPNL